VGRSGRVQRLGHVRCSEARDGGGGFVDRFECGLDRVALAGCVVSLKRREQSEGKMKESKRKVQVTLEIDADRQEVFSRMVSEFFRGETKHDEAIRARAKDQEQGVASLKRLYEVAQGHSGQCRYIAEFLAGVYNGSRFPFDLTNLRCLDPELVEHCLAVLRMDARCEGEVHTYFEDGGRLWAEMIERWGILDLEERGRGEESSSVAAACGEHSAQ
jgi:hypothetical protein